MPTEELKFEDLIKEYIEVVESTDVTKLKEENKTIKVDIERKGKEENDIDARIEEIQAELDSLNENSTVKLEYPEAIKDKENKLKEAKEFKEKKEKEIQNLKDKTKENNKQIRKVNNIGKDVIKKAEEKTNKENEELEKKIEDLKKEIEKQEERKAKYGLRRIAKEGKEDIQYTKEEKVMVNSIDEEIKKINEEIDKTEHEIKDNRKAFLIFKQTIEKSKKDKEVFLDLKNKVKGKEEPLEEKIKDEQKKEENNSEQNTENEKEEVKKTEEIPEEIPVMPADKVSRRIDNNDYILNPNNKEILEEIPVMPADKVSKRIDNNDYIPNPIHEIENKAREEELSKEGKREYKGKVIPGVPQPEYEIHEVKGSEKEEKDIYSNSYEKNLEEYKEMLSMYKDAFLALGDLQQQYENGEIDYSEYEEQALYVAERYEFMKGEYAKIKEQYDIEKTKQDKFTNITNEDLENRLKELDEETTELWQQGVHENTPNEKRYHQALEEIRRIKEELATRKENPLRGMSLEELEARKNELYAKIAEQQEPDEHHFRTYEENGLEGYEEDDIDKGLREIREEIERRQPNLEAPEEPVKAGMILKNDKEDKIPPIERNLPLPDTGLAVLTDIFTHKDMPEIKAKHVASENPALVIGKYALPLAAVCGAVPVTGWVAGLGVTAASIGIAATIKPIVAKFTGRKKITEEIKDVIREFPDSRLELLAEYLNENTIRDIMPNHIFLDALQDVLGERAIITKEKNTGKLDNVEYRMQEIVYRKQRLAEQLRNGNLTSEERNNIESEIKGLDLESMDLYSRIQGLKADTEEKDRQFIQVRRGKERKGHKFRGNVEGKFDGLFAIKNMPSKEYVPALIKLREKEKAIQISELTGKSMAEAYLEDKKFKREHSKDKTRKTRRLQFNFNKENDIISDREERRIEDGARLGFVITAATIGAIDSYREQQVAEQNYRAAEHNASQLEAIQQEQAQIESNIDSDGVLSGAASDQITKDEYAAFSVDGDSSVNSAYLSKDASNQIKADNTIDNLPKGKVDAPTTLRKWSEIIEKGRDSHIDLGKEAANGGFDHFNADHSKSGDLYEGGANGEYVDAQVGFLNKTADFMEKCKNITIEHGIKPIFNMFKHIAPAFALGEKIATEAKINKDRDGIKAQDTKEER